MRIARQSARWIGDQVDRFITFYVVLGEVHNHRHGLSVRQAGATLSFICNHQDHIE